MQIKEGVIMAGLKIEMRPALTVAGQEWERLGKELVITSALDGTHSAGSLHYYGYAVDLRTYYFSIANKRTAANRLRNRLGDDFDVIEHDSHIHCEYDPRPKVT